MIATGDPFSDFQSGHVVAVWPIKWRSYCLNNIAFKTSPFIIRGHLGVDLFNLAIYAALARWEKPFSSIAIRQS
jgi:hypothetical protein